MDDKEKEGYDMIKYDKGGFPDFKVFNFETGNSFWIEVKSSPELYTDNQKEKFPKITKKLIIALVEKGKITYKDYKTGEVITTSSYSQTKKVEPNIKCKKCNYTWFTTTKMFFVTCPYCRKLVSLKDQAVVEVTNEE